MAWIFDRICSGVSPLSAPAATAADMFCRPSSTDWPPLGAELPRPPSIAEADASAPFRASIAPLVSPPSRARLAWPMLPVFSETMVWTLRHSSALSPLPDVSVAPVLADWVDPWLSRLALADGSTLSLVDSLAVADAETDGDAMTEGLELACGLAAFVEQAAVPPAANSASKTIEVAVRPVRVMRLAYHEPTTTPRHPRADS